LAQNLNNLGAIASIKSNKEKMQQTAQIKFAQTTTNRTTSANASKIQF